MKRIKYVSRFAPELPAADVEAIVHTSRANNPKRGITGILMMSGRVFFQVLEGPAEEIDKLYATIRKDPRHVDVFLLDSVEDCRERLFPDWSLQKIDLNDEADRRMEPTRALLKAVVEQGATMHAMLGALERIVWQEAVTPAAA